MSAKMEATLAIVAALLVLFSAMMDPRLSAGAAVVLLAGLAIFKLVQKPRAG